MERHSNGSWDLDLGGICFRELKELGEMLRELGENGELYGVKFDLETLGACFDARTGEVIIYDGDGNTTAEE